MTKTATLLAGVPALNQALYHRIRFAVGDSAACIEMDDGSGGRASMLLVRDIEMARARKHARADRVGCAAEYAPEGGLSGDRDTALAQATAECLRRAGVERVLTDRTLPFIFAWHVREAGIALEYEADLGVLARRVKDGEEIAAMRRAQQVTEETMAMACGAVARASAGTDGVLHHEGAPLTSERLRRMISVFLLDKGFSNPHDSIVASVPHVADCHHAGTGPIRTGQSVVIDIFPRDDETRYWGDCTRTVVHGEPNDELSRMHAAVVEAKAASLAAMRAGVTGEQVHQATASVLEARGYVMGVAPDDAPDDFTSMPHGTGHGIGLDVHEPILLDRGGGPMLAGEVFTVEPGLYSRAWGGVRVEDMVVVTDTGCENLNTLPEGLAW